MKRLIAFTAILALVVQANAVTASNSSTSVQAPETAKKRHVINTMTVPVEAAPAADSAQASDQLTLDNEAAVANEVEAAEAQQILTRVEEQKESRNNFYLSGSVGLGGYPEVNNIQTGAAANLSFGYMIDRTWMIEIGGGVGQYKMDIQSFQYFGYRENYEVNQYSGHLAARYRITDGPIVPNAGIMASYTQRQFTLLNPYNATNSSVTENRGSTNATDAGIVAGLDYEISESLAIGLDLRYMFNVSNNSQAVTVNGPVYNGSTGNTIEKLQYYNAGISARMNF